MNRYSSNTALAISVTTVVGIALLCKAGKPVTHAVADAGLLRSLTGNGKMVCTKRWVPWYPKISQNPMDNHCFDPKSLINSPATK